MHFLKSSNSYDCVIFNFVDSNHNCRLGLSVKQLCETQRLIKRRLGEDGDAFHITILFDVVDDFMNKRETGR